MKQKRTEQIKAAIAFGGKTQSRVARSLDMPPQTLSTKIARGKLSQDELAQIAEAIGAVHHSYFEFPDGTKI